MSKKVNKHFEWTAHPREIDTDVSTWGQIDSNFWYYGFNKRGKQVCKMSTELYNTLRNLR